MQPVRMCAVFALAVMVPLGAQDASAPSLLPPGEAGTPLHVEGRILGPAGPVAGAAMYVYQTDQRGYYSSEVNDDNTKPRLKARFQTGPDGSFAFRTIMPGQYPQSGPPAHIHLEVTPTGRPVERYEIVFEGDSRLSERDQGRRARRQVLRAVRADDRRRRREAVHRRHLPRPLTPRTTPESWRDDSGVLARRFEKPRSLLGFSHDSERPRRLRVVRRTPESSGERDAEGGGAAGGALEGVVEAVAG